MAGARRTPRRGSGEPDFLGILVAASHNTIFQVGLAMLEDLINQQWQALARLIRESRRLANRNSRRLSHARCGGGSRPSPMRLASAAKLTR